MTAIRVAVVGAGEAGTPLLKLLLDADFVTVVGVADLDADQPGMTLAREHGVRRTGSFMELAELGEDVDILIDVTGVRTVRDQLRAHLMESHD